MPIDEAQATILPFPESAERRLRVALRNLEQAVADQREAVATFRQELATLNTAMAGLGDSTAVLRSKLDDAAEDTLRAQNEARRLDVTAQAMARYL